MEWIVRIEGEDEKKERIKVVFDPMAEQVHFYGEYKVSNKVGNKDNWIVFCEYIHKMEIDLETMKGMMEKCIETLRKRAKVYDELAKGFTLLTWIGYDED